MKKILIIVLILSAASCKNQSRNDDEYPPPYSVNDENQDSYSDGTYCAEIEYYYSKTGTRSTYILVVEVEDNKLTVIHWPNGGWLDDSHFYPPDISDGYAKFESDIGAEYTINIIGDEDDCSLSNYPPSENSHIEDEEYNDDENGY